MVMVMVMVMAQAVGELPIPIGWTPHNHNLPRRLYMHIIHFHPIISGPKHIRLDHAAVLSSEQTSKQACIPANDIPNHVQCTFKLDLTPSKHSVRSIVATDIFLPLSIRTSHTETVMRSICLSIYQAAMHDRPIHQSFRRVYPFVSILVAWALTD